jgi:hypothetical protein
MLGGRGHVTRAQRYEHRFELLPSSSEIYGDQPPSSSISSTETSAAYLPSRMSSIFFRFMALSAS